ncbi:MAG: phosphoglucosamine mutase [Desulfurococcales archaeon]|nr:phosphoglucosamine mutase [Desulfurococcales archaeon]
MGKLFGTDGVRGIVGKDMTPELALRLGRAIGAYFGRGARILLGRDVRSGGDILVRAVSAGLQSQGVKVYYAGLLPTPALQYGVKEEYDGGVMVTASHNPPEYNGIKVIGPEGVEIPREDEAVIEEYYFKGVGGGEWRSLTLAQSEAAHIIEMYIDAVVSQVDGETVRRAKLSAVVDCGNSVGSLTTPLILGRIGVRVYTVNCNLDPLFPGREPEPTPHNLDLASLAVKGMKADFGIGHDGDADRAIVIDDQGEAYWGDRMGAALTAFARDHWPGLPPRTYTGVSSSTVIEDYLKDKGIEVVWTPVGSVVISRMILRDGGAISGFEENGGYMHVPHQVVRDGGMTAALVAYMIAAAGEPLSRIMEAIPRYHQIKTKIPASKDQARCAVERVREHYSNLRQVDIDGVKVFGDGFWILVRPSGTEPVLRIMLEAETRDKAEKLLEEVKNVVSTCLRGAQE